MRRDSFQAIADPTRREILSIIANRPLTVNAVAGNFGVSRTAVYKHIKILTECGLIIIKQQGRQRYCEARMEKLHEVSDWVRKYQKSRDVKFDALKIYLNSMQGVPEKYKKRKKR